MDALEVLRNSPMDPSDVLRASLVVMILMIGCVSVAGILMLVRKIARHRIAIVDTIKGLLPHKRPAYRRPP